MEPMFDANAPLTTYQQANLDLQQASLDIQQASLNLQQASLDLQQASVDATLAGVAAQQAGNEIALWIGITQAAVALTVGLIQAGVVGWGIRYMIRMSERREQQHADRHAETMEAFRLQTTASREQHTATMRALEALIERTAPSRA